MSQISFFFSRKNAALYALKLPNSNLESCILNNIYIFFSAFIKICHKTFHKKIYAPTLAKLYARCDAKSTQNPILITIVTIEMKFKRTSQKVIKPRMPTLILTIVSATQTEAIVSGINNSETMITAAPAIAIVVNVAGSTALYCSANCKTSSWAFSKLRHYVPPHKGS